MHLSAQNRKTPELLPSIAPRSRFGNAEYLAIICHEIRTPLNAIVGLSNVIANQQCSPQRQKECLNMLSDSSGMLTGLLNNLLDSFKLDNGSVELERITFDLTKVLEEAKNIITIKAQEKNLKIHMRIGKGVPALFEGDPLRIRQILLNLLGNAVKFADNGIISLYMSESTGSDGYSEVCITVADCGIGIKREKLGKIFDMYTQGDASTSREHGGTGLGLFICQQLIQLMNGTIVVKSWPRVGSHFIVTLPLRKAHELRTMA